MNYKVVIFGVKSTTEKIINFLYEHSHKIDLVVTIDTAVQKRNDISGLSDLTSTCEKLGIQMYYAADYGLSDDQTRAFFTENSFDIGISMGWQRLIPEEVLNRFTYGVFGFHGSCGYLPYGRGRSPMNWSLINGDSRVVMNLFRYDKAADSPNIFKKQVFEINPHDTILTLQYKNLLCAQNLIQELLEAYQNHSIKIETNSKDFDTWYPKRTPADGKIDFRMKTREIYNLVRGVTRPFPGAFIETAEGNIKVWKAYPFDQIMDFSNYCPGEIIEIYDDNLIIRTIDGTLIVTEYTSDIELKRGMQLQNGTQHKP